MSDKYISVVSMFFIIAEVESNYNIIIFIAGAITLAIGSVFILIEKKRKKKQ